MDGKNCRKSRNISRDVVTKCFYIDKCTYWKKLTEGVFYVWRKGEPVHSCDRTFRCRQNSCMPLGMHRSHRGTFRTEDREKSSNGLFNHFASGDTVPVLCIDEAHSFLMKISSFSKSQQANLTVECLCKCFDGDCWYVLKGNKGKQAGVPSARASLLAFTTPKQFLETVWTKMLTADNGFTERVLLFYQKKRRERLGGHGRPLWSNGKFSNPVFRWGNGANLCWT